MSFWVASLRTLWGKPTIRDTLCRLEFEISPHAFYQVNRTQAEALYNKAAEYAGLTGAETLLDLYCGTGTIGLSMAHLVREVIGVEIVKEAVENAKENAQRNNIQNARFLCADAAGRRHRRWPRKNCIPMSLCWILRERGCDASLLETIGQMAPGRIVMISCNSATAARDAAILCQNGYQAAKLQAVDMFPRTVHVECVCLFSRTNL